MTNPIAGLIARRLSTALATAALPGAHATAAFLFGLGLGWNFSFVAASAVLADRTALWERGRPLGLNDLLSGATGAGLTLLGGFVLSAVGATALATGALALLVAPALWILRARDSWRRSS